jgi:hypothetical protein
MERIGVSYPVAFLEMGTGIFPWDVKLTAHHPVPRLRMRGAIPPLSQYAFMA